MDTEWGEADAAAVRAIVAELRAELGDPRADVYCKARRAYYARTGRVRVHGLEGASVESCRCQVCRDARRDYRLLRLSGQRLSTRRRYPPRASAGWP